MKLSLPSVVVLVEGGARVMQRRILTTGVVKYAKYLFLSAVASVVAWAETVGAKPALCCTRAERCARPWEQSGGVACSARARCECQ